MLGASERPLTAAYDLAMLDLDGVVYVGAHAVPGARESIRAARAAGQQVAFVTNNAARTPKTVAAHLTGLGIEATVEDVVTSAQAGARLLRERFGGEGPVFLCGGDGVEAALHAEGLEPTTDPARAEVVITGYGPDLPWRRILQASILVREGLPWVATNADLTIPTASGVGPGHGAVVRMIAEFSGHEALVAGKPARPLLDETIRRMRAARPLMVGDRLDTDIEGAHRAGVDSLLVLTGVSGLDDLAAATPELRPTYISGDLSGLVVAHPEVVFDADGAACCGGWAAMDVDGGVRVTGAGGCDDWWRAVASACWRHLDAGGAPLGTAGLVPGSPGAGR